MKKDKLYTVNKFNKQLLMPEKTKNLFAPQLFGSSVLERMPKGTTSTSGGMAGLLSGQLSNSSAFAAPSTDNLNTLYRGYMGLGNYGSTSLNGVTASGMASPTANPLTSGYHITPGSYIKERLQADLSPKSFVATEPTVEESSNSPFTWGNLKSTMESPVTQLATDLASKYIFKTTGETAAKAATQATLSTAAKSAIQQSAAQAVESAAQAGMTGAALDLVKNQAIQEAINNTAVSGASSAASGAGSGFSGALGASSLSAAESAGIGIAGSLIGQGAKYLISDGYSSGVGNAIADIGGAAGGVVGYFNPIIGAAVSAATGAIGGLYNRAFSIKTNQEALANNEAAKRYYTSYQGGANSFDDIPTLTALTYKQPYKSGWLKSADSKNDWAWREYLESKSFAERGVENDIYNIMRNKLGRQYANSSAEGGAIDTSGTDYSKDLDAIGVDLANLYRSDTISGEMIKDQYGGNNDFFMYPTRSKRLQREARLKMGTLDNNLNNLLYSQLGNTLANYSAYGGLVNSLGLMQQNKYLDAINNRSKALAQKNTFDLGGTFLDEFGSDPIGAAVRYNQGIERMEAEKEAAEAQAAQAAEYAAMQQRLASLETQNQGLQAIMAATQTPATPEIAAVPTEAVLEVSSTPSKAVRARRSGNRNWDYIEEQLKKSGKFNDVQIEGIKYNLQRESGIGMYDGGDNGTAHGLAQWRGARVPKDMSLEGQTQYLIDTLSNYDGKLHWIGRGNYEGFMNARTPEEAHYYIARGYERPHKDIVAKVKRDSDMSLSRLKAFGGELGTNGTDFTNGLLYIDEGGTHEDNPLDGVPMGLDAEGIPNLVEEGETVYNDYVFSDRMMVPDFMYKELGLGGIIKKKGRKGMSFADASKKLAQESEQRPNDPISQAGLNASLSKLAEVQETERMRKQMEEYVGLDEYACGGKMHKYGLGGNMFVNGGALEWVNGNHKGGNKKHIAAAIDSYLSKHPDLAKAKDFVKYGQAYDAIMRGSGNTGLVTPSRAGKNSDIGRKHFDELVQLGMPKNVAFGIAFPDGEGYSDREGFHSTRKEREALYGELVKGNKAAQNKNNQPAQKQASQPAKSASAQQAASQSAAPQSTPVASTPAASVQGSSRGAGKNTGNSGRVLSDLNYGNAVTSGDPVLDAIAFNPPTEGIRESAQQPVIDEATRQRIAMDGYNPEYTARDAAAVDALTEGYGLDAYTPKKYATWMRYAPVGGLGLMTLTDALGLTNKPDYTYADKLEAAANAAAYAPHIEAEPIGNYLRYNPMDIWYKQNELNAQSRATDRAILNSGANQGSKEAALLASGYNSQLASGNLYRQALEYNDAQRQAVENFNRGTNMFNSQMGLEADMANARYRQQAQQLGISGLAQAAALRDSIDQRVGAAKAANLSNFLTSLGNIGRENFAMNQINWDRSRRYYGSLDGTNGFKSSKYGGKIRKRK